jgi:hypothetical protein
LRLRRLLLPALFAVALSAPAQAQPYLYRWDAASGLYPDQGCPFWTLIDNSAAQASLSGGLLTLTTTTTGSNNLGYEDLAPDVLVPTPWIIEFRARFISSGTSNTARSGMMVQAGTGSNRVASVMFEADRIRMLSGDFTIGASVVVDTDNSLHTYRLEIAAPAVGSAVRLYQDNVLVLTGAIWSSPNVIANANILWGDVSSLALGSSEWAYFEHNGSNASCVTPTAPTSWGRVKTIYR